MTEIYEYIAQSLIFFPGWAAFILKKYGSSSLLKTSLCFGILFSFSLAFAQLSYKGEFEFSSSVSATQAKQLDSSQFSLALRAHLEADYDVSPLSFRLVLEPGVNLNGPLIDNVVFEPGLTEAYALYRLDTLDFSAGLERLPLEYARLSAPFSIEPIGKTGLKQGLWGARATLYLNDWRVRPALVYRSQDEQAGAVISVKKNFSDFELEAHTLYLDQRFALGLGGSGLLGDLIIYGETWLLSNDFEGRAALGLSGFWDDKLWMLEAAYAPNPLVPKVDAVAQILGQISIPQGENGSVEFGTALAYLDQPPLIPQTLYALINASYQISEQDYTLSTGITALISEQSQSYNLNFSLTGFF